ncbi:MAG: 3-dehydroquinate synthase [Calditrichaeota bacterium]|nr:MAG: 3-dehydroquinate synthase [Calditrichota bacterium]
MKTLKVELVDRSYPIYIGNGNLDKLAEMVKLFFTTKNFVLISDKNVFPLYGQIVINSFAKAGLRVEKITVSAGEKSKSLSCFDEVLTKMLKLNASRDWMVLALGGGVIGDLAGFSAASFMRGVPFIQIPTSLLAQVDSSVGGKTGINHPLAKNVIGSFYQPKMVWIDMAVLKTLEPVEIISGLAEILKYGIINDRDFFHFCEENIGKMLALDDEVCVEAIYRCCKIKAKIVAQDEREAGLRAILNFGHTFGHAIETVFNYQKIKHGEAVLWGMLAEAHMAVELGLLNQKEFERIRQLFHKIPMQSFISDINFDSLMLAMKRDKKAQDNKLRFALPKSIGETIIVVIERENLIRNAFNFALANGWRG